jgi:hypothetical protein
VSLALIAKSIVLAEKFFVVPSKCADQSSDLLIAAGMGLPKLLYLGLIHNALSVPWAAESCAWPALLSGTVRAQTPKNC